MISLGTNRFASRHRHKLHPILLGEHKRVALKGGSLVLTGFRAIIQTQIDDKVECEQHNGTRRQGQAVSLNLCPALKFKADVLYQTQLA